MELNADRCEQNGETNDLVIASAVEVLITMYECKFCNKRFDTIDKVKAHFLKRHSNTLETIIPQSLADIVNNEVIADDDSDMKTDLSNIKNEQSPQIVINESLNDMNIFQNETGVKTTTVVIKKTQPNTRSNRSKKLENNITFEEQESNVTLNRTISTRSSIKKELPSHLEVKVIRSDYDPNAPLKRGRPKKYEFRPQTVPPKLRSAPRRYPCPFDGCEYIAKYRSNLWDHKKIHTGEKPYICTWPSCDMRFPQSQQLRLHLRSHTGEKPYKCEWNGCQMAFSQKPGLKAHLRTHTGEKPFNCDWPGCEWKFRLKGALTDHKKAVHENVKSFICEWPGCNKKFLQSCHLRKHMMAHADIKPYQCDWPACNYRAVSLSYVTNHKKTHTGEKNFECNFPDCNKRFVKSNHVLRHQQRCHPELFDEIIDDSFKEDEQVFSMSTVDVEITAI